MRKRYSILKGVICVLMFLVIGSGNVLAANNDSDAEELPLYSPEYLTEYIEKNDIKLPKVKKKKTIEKILKDDDSAVCLKQKNEKYVVTREDTDLLYIGDVKDNKPDGEGKIYKLYTAKQTKDIDDKVIMDFEEAQYAEDESELYAVLVYVGEFKKGYYEGYGWEYSVPSVYEDVLGKGYVSFYGDMQKDILASCNPLAYMGEFKKGKYNGEGIKIRYPIQTVGDLSEDMVEGLFDVDIEREKREIEIYEGEYKKGKLNGDVKMYVYGKLLYDGEMEKGRKDGKGTLYFKETEQIKYKGEWTKDVYDGKGTLYDENGDKVYSGEWVMGDYAS